MPRDFARDVEPVFEPRQLRARRDGEDRYLAVLTLITELGYVLAMVSEMRFSVV